MLNLPDVGRVLLDTPKQRVEPDPKGPGLQCAQATRFSSGSRYGQIASAMARAPASFGCTRSGCISAPSIITVGRMNGTSGTRYFAASSSYALWNATE